MNENEEPPRPRGTRWDCTDEEYYADAIGSTPTLSASIAKLLVKCPSKAWHAHPRLGGAKNKQTRAMASGSLIDAILTTDGSKVVVVEHSQDAKGKPVVAPTDRRLSATKEQIEVAESAGLVPCLKHEYENAVSVASAVRAKAASFGYPIDTGEFQTMFVWDEIADDGTVVRCRCRMDIFHPSSGIVQDIKRLSDCSRDGVRRAVRQFGYDIQAAAYLSAVRTALPDLEGREKFLLVCAEEDAPFPLSVVSVSGPLLELGNRKWRHAVNLWARLMSERPDGNWPDYCEQVMRIEPTAWELSESEFSE